MEIINIAKNATNDVQSSRQMSRREAEIICWEAKRYQVMNQYLNAPDTYNETSAPASSIRRDILDKNRWKFARSYGGAEILTSLRQHLKWILIGAKDTLDLNVKKKKIWMRQIQISEKLLSRQPNKKEKQVNDTSGKYKQKVEPPFSVGLGIYFHQ